MPDQSPDVSVSIEDVLAEMNELGRALFDAAQARALCVKLQRRVAELENAANPGPAAQI